MGKETPVKIYLLMCNKMYTDLPPRCLAVHSDKEAAWLAADTYNTRENPFEYEAWVEERDIIT